MIIAGERKNSNNYINLNDKLKFALTIVTIVFIEFFFNVTSTAAQLKAGAAKISITNLEIGGLLNDSLYVKALVLENGTTKAAIVTVDAVAIGGIGSINDDYLTKVRTQIEKELNIKGRNVMVNASHLHGAGYNVHPDIANRTVKAVKMAWQNRVPVNIGVGTGYEDRIMENRRLKLKNGRVWAIRHANPLPPDEEVIGIGPVDPEIGILRLDRKNGKPLAVVYNFACHAYQDVPSRAITADFPGIASKVIEDNLGDDAIALFLQGCGGDITTVLYKDVSNPRDAVPLGNMLGLSTLKALRNIETGRNGDLNVISEIIKLPRRTDIVQRIDSLEDVQAKLLKSFRGTSLNIKMFIPLYIKYNLSNEFPSYYSHWYLHDRMIGRNDLEMMDAENRKNIDKYLKNIYAMESLARMPTIIQDFKKMNAINEVSGEKTIDVEIQAMRIGQFILVAFPAEVSAQVGLNIKKMSPHEFTFVAGFSNGYLFYGPTAEQFKGIATEDTKCFFAPEWQKIYEEKVAEILKKL